MHRLHTASTRLAIAAGALATGLILTGCSSGAAPTNSQTKGVTITVALAASPPPKAALAAFTKDTGITVNWSNIAWPDLQTKITSAAEANTYFADATDVDWSRTGQFAKLGWFIPMQKYIDTKSLAKDMPQLTSFTSNGQVVGIPYDASFTVTTVNKQIFDKAQITDMPTTMADYTKDLQQIKEKGILANPLNIPFAAVEGLSTYWYQTAAAFGGGILNAKGEPQFTDPNSGGYKAAQWMVDSYKGGLVPPGNINIKGGDAQQTLVAKGLVASTLSDYAGNVGSLYNIPSESTVVGQIDYIPTPGVGGQAAPNLSNPDGIGIPKSAKYPAAAAKFIEWLVSTQNQAAFAGADGPDKVWSSYPLPSRSSAIAVLNAKGKLAGGDQLLDMLRKSEPVFPNGAPTWYAQFSNSVYTNLHAAAVGSMTVPDAIAKMAGTAKSLSTSSGSK